MFVGQRCHREQTVIYSWLSFSTESLPTERQTDRQKERGREGERVGKRIISFIELRASSSNRGTLIHRSFSLQFAAAITVNASHSCRAIRREKEKGKGEKGGWKNKKREKEKEGKKEKWNDRWNGSITAEHLRYSIKLEIGTRGGGGVMCSTLYRDYITRIDNVCVLGRRMEGSAQRCIVYSSEFV